MVDYNPDSDGVMRWWRKADGKLMHLQEMDLGHIHNTIVMLQEGRLTQGNPNLNGRTAGEWINLFTNELRRRAHT